MGLGRPVFLLFGDFSTDSHPAVTKSPLSMPIVLAIEYFRKKTAVNNSSLYESARVPCRLAQRLA